MEFNWRLIICVLLLVACSPAARSTAVSTATATPGMTSLPSPVGTPPAGTGTDPATPVIVYGRSGGIAGGQSVWRVYADGRITSEVNGKPGTEGRTTADNVVAVVKRLVDAGFFDLSGSYMPDNPCCDRYTYTISVTYNGVSKTVQTMDGVQIPPALSTALSSAGTLVRQ